MEDDRRLPARPAASGPGLAERTSRTATALNAPHTSSIASWDSKWCRPRSSESSGGNAERSPSRIQPAMAEADRLERNIEPPDTEAFVRQIFRMRLFDNLISNPDRHLHNLLIAPEWQLRLIDQLAAFRKMSDLRDPRTLTRFSHSLVEAMVRLSDARPERPAGPLPVRVADPRPAAAPRSSGAAGEADGRSPRRSCGVPIREPSDRATLQTPRGRPRCLIPRKFPQASVRIVTEAHGPHWVAWASAGDDRRPVRIPCCSWGRRERKPRGARNAGWRARIFQRGKKSDPRSGGQRFSSPSPSFSSSTGSPSCRICPLACPSRMQMWSLRFERDDRQVPWARPIGGRDTPAGQRFKCLKLEDHRGAGVDCCRDGGHPGTSCLTPCKWNAKVIH